MFSLSFLNLLKSIVSDSKIFETKYSAFQRLQLYLTINNYSFPYCYGLSYGAIILLVFFPFSSIFPIFLTDPIFIHYTKNYLLGIWPLALIII